MSGCGSGFSVSAVRVTGLGCTAVLTFRRLSFSRRWRNLDVLDMVLCLSSNIDFESSNDGVYENPVVRRTAAFSAAAAAAGDF